MIRIRRKRRRTREEIFEDTVKVLKKKFTKKQLMKKNKIIFCFEAAAFFLREADEKFSLESVSEFSLYLQDHLY